MRGPTSRAWLLLTAAYATLLLNRGALGGETLDLSGMWRVRLDANADPESRPEVVADGPTCRLPGSIQEQGLGELPSVDSPWTPDTADRNEFFTSPRYAAYRDAGNFKVPFALQPKRLYVGAATFQREIVIPAEWEGKRAVLSLERPHWFTDVWLDDQKLGRGDSLSTPHEFELPSTIAPGEHTLVVRVDNRPHVDVGSSAHSVTDYTQTNWNGIVGRVELRVTPEVWIDHVRVENDVNGSRFRVTPVINNRTDVAVTSRVLVRAVPRSGGEAQIATASVRAEPGSNRVALSVDLGPCAELWDEFDPNLYDVEVELQTEDGATHTETVLTGLREIGRSGTQITVNGRPTFLRGTLECAVFPKTGYPPVDVDSWKAIYRRCQEFGLNHVRFHSWCPPEAAFIAADELGVYLQPEAASWAHLGSGEPIDDWVIAETERILKTYGNHPSFVMMAYGNEPKPHNKSRDAYLAKWLEKFQLADPRRLYCCASGWPALPGSDFHVLPAPRLHQWGAGLKSRLNAKPPTTQPDHRRIVARHDKPLVAHEIGQWCVFPNLGERKKYGGVLSAKNYDIFADFLEAAGMGHQAEDFLMASGRLQELCYKEEVETAIRTPGLGGFQLLGLSDFPGQGTAPVGLCDAFWDVKPYASAERFRSSCDRVVPIARLAKRVFTAGDTLEADLEVANYGPSDLRDTTWRWRLASSGRTLGEGELSCSIAPCGGLIDIGRVRVSLASSEAPCRATLSVTGPDALKNQWAVWIYPDADQAAAEPAVRIARKLDQTTRDALARGESVVLFASPELVRSEVEVGFSPIFWNTSYTNNQPPHTLGLLIKSAHPAVAHFPTETYSDWQWWEIVHGCRAMEIDELPAAVEPIVQVVPDWFNPKRLALVFEARVGRGRLLVCSADLESRLPDRHAARTLRDSLVRYAMSDEFTPDVQVEIGRLETLFSPTD